MVLLSDLPIFKNTCLDLEKVAIQEEATKMYQQDENNDNDTDSGIGDSTPPSPTWTYDEDVGDNLIQLDQQYSLIESLNTKFIYREKSIQEATDGKYNNIFKSCILSFFNWTEILLNWYLIEFLIVLGAWSSHCNDSTINEQTIHPFEHVQLNSEQSTSNAFHDRSNNQENSSHLCSSTMKNGERNVVSNSIIVLNSSLPQRAKSLTSSVYENDDSNDSQAKDRKELPSSLTYGSTLKKRIDDKNSYRNYIKLCVKTTFKSLTKHLYKKTNDEDSKTIKSSSEAQSWADIRVLPNIQQNL